MKTKPLTPSLTSTLVVDIRTLVHDARAAVAVAVNSGITLLYWRIGKRINEDVLKGERAEYGKQIVSTLSRQLVQEYGTSFAEKNLRRMMQFGEAFPDEQIVVSLIRQLTWTHFLALIPLKKPLQQDFYSEMCRLEKWEARSVATRREFNIIGNRGMNSPSTVPASRRDVTFAVPSGRRENSRGIHTPAVASSRLSYQA